MNGIDSYIPGHHSISDQPSADLVLRDAIVYTADRMQPWAQAVAVRGGEIVYVGSSDGVGTWIGPMTEVIALKGRMVRFPGASA
jgi:predicted amidohydrolase YtcJ